MELPFPCFPYPFVREFQPFATSIPPVLDRCWRQCKPNFACLPPACSHLQMDGQFTGCKRSRQLWKRLFLPPRAVLCVPVPVQHRPNPSTLTHFASGVHPPNHPCTLYPLLPTPCWQETIYPSCERKHPRIDARNTEEPTTPSPTVSPPL